MKPEFSYPGFFWKKKNKPHLLSEAVSDGIKDVFNEMGYRKVIRTNPMTMRPDSLNNKKQIDLIATCLADNFVKKIYNLQNEKSYSAYVKSLSEIFHWAHEFYIEYNHKIKDWESFGKSGDNIYKATTREAFQIAWGNERMQIFTDQHSKNSSQEIIYLKSAPRNNFIEPEVSEISI
jgi:hypothetical protein